MLRFATPPSCAVSIRLSGHLVNAEAEQSQSQAKAEQSQVKAEQSKAKPKQTEAERNEKEQKRKKKTYIRHTLQRKWRHTYRTCLPYVTCPEVTAGLIWLKPYSISKQQPQLSPAQPSSFHLVHHPINLIML